MSMLRRFPDSNPTQELGDSEIPRKLSEILASGAETNETFENFIIEDANRMPEGVSAEQPTACAEYVSSPKKLVISAFKKIWHKEGIKLGRIRPPADRRLYRRERYGL